MQESNLVLMAVGVGALFAQYCIERWSPELAGAFGRGLARLARHGGPTRRNPMSAPPGGGAWPSRT